MARPRAEASVSIDAPIERVWRVMMDVHRYHEWNPFIVKVTGFEGEPRVGTEMNLHVKWNTGGGVVSREKFSRIEPPREESGVTRAVLEYVFLGVLPALYLVRGARVQTLEQRAGGPTLYRSEEEFYGLLAFGVPLARVRDGFERHARALKQRAESATERS